MAEMELNRTKTRTDSCPEPSQITQLAEGTLSEPAFSLCLIHIENCSHCEKILSLNLTDPHFPKILSNYEHSPRDLPVPGLLPSDPLAPITPGKTGETVPAAIQTEDQETVGPIPHSLPEFAKPDNPDDLGRIGRFRIQKLLYPGNIGYTYKAFDTHLNRPVAIKLLRPSLSKNPEWRAAFLSEAQTASSINSPNIIPIHHVDQFQDFTFFVMPFLVGETLARKLKSGPLPSHLVAKIGLGILSGLEAAHNAGIIHRDIKPANIWLKSDTLHQEQEPVLFDFGIASTTNYGLNSTGTKGYHSPEQSQGEIGDLRSDFFSFGCVLYEMVSGKMAFPQQLPQEAIARPLEDPSVPKPWLPLLTGLLALDPRKRPENHQIIRQQLNALSQKSGSRRYLLASVGVTFVGALLAISLSSFWNGPSTSTPLEAVTVFPSLGNMPYGPVIVLGNDGVLFRSAREKTIVANFPGTKEKSINLPVDPVHIAWSAPFLAVMDQEGTVFILEVFKDSHRLIKEYSKPKEITEPFSGLDWSKTDPTRLLISFGNRFFVTQSENGKFPNKLTPKGTRIPGIAGLDPALYRWQPQNDHIQGLMKPGGLLCLNIASETFVFGLRPFSNGPPTATFSEDGSILAAASPNGKLAIFLLGSSPSERGIKPNASAVPFIPPEQILDLGTTISDVAFVSNDHLAILFPEENQFPIRLFNPGMLSQKPVILNCQGKRIARIVADVENHRLAALASDHSVFLFDCSKIKFE